MDCLYPKCAPMSSYQYGCRCQRCYGAHKAYHKAYRETNGRPIGRSNPKEVQCVQCRNHFYAVQETQIKTDIILCTSCKATWQRTIKLWRMHGASSELILQWMAKPVCWICEQPISTAVYNGKAAWNVDHDHTCHPGSYGCKHCIRGLAHARCNMSIGQLEALIQSLGVKRFDEVAAQLSEPFRWVPIRESLQ